MLPLAGADQPNGHADAQTATPKLTKHIKDIKPMTHPQNDPAAQAPVPQPSPQKLPFTVSLCHLVTLDSANLPHLAPSPNFPLHRPFS